MIGTPPSARKPSAIPTHPVKHLKDFAVRYCELLEIIARKRMREAGVPEDRIGMIDADFDFRLAAFHPHQTDGGGVHPPTGRINLDAGIFKPDLLAEMAPPEVSSLHGKAVPPSRWTPSSPTNTRKACGGVTPPPRNMPPIRRWPSKQNPGGCSEP